MVKYNQNWTSIYNYSFKYGGINVYMQTNLKEEKDLNNYNFDNDTNELYLNAYFNIRVLNDFIDKRIEEFSTFSIDDESLELKSKWLNDWKTNRKKEVFIDIDQLMISGNVNEEKLTKLNKRIKRYFRYFDLIDRESNVTDKYGEIFNTIIQIPAEIYGFIKKGSSKQNGEFIKSKYYYNDNKISSSVSIEDDILNISI